MKRSLWVALIAAALLSACGKLNLAPGPGPSPSSSPTTQPSPGVCNTPDASNTNLVVVAMGSAISATTAPTYGKIGGYSVANLSTGTFSNQSTVINQTLPSGGKAITSNNVLQFANVESASGSVINHSAVGFKGDAFPAEPYTFPSPAASPVATAVSTSALWSTGRVSPPLYQQCFSQVFSLKPGVYYFGDLGYYNVTTFRDVLIVATPAATDQEEAAARMHNRRLSAEGRRGTPRLLTGLF
jgi:hypothetical protein